VAGSKAVDISVIRVVVRFVTRRSYTEAGGVECKGWGERLKIFDQSRPDIFIAKGKSSLLSAVHQQSSEFLVSIFF